ncbi:uncharacterized protein zgc:193726 isoform X2 [Carassius gibelio]|uniref:uncharacterized protein zgc:193726 isoform X2 n=1 Tax=Carassius gibelio TaxID=101364 RepID=UPI0022780B84|nr:uncharacterized protein zgc:193726 isoform X2 [Carassius gibelio]
MNSSMFLVWTLSSLILSYTLGLPNPNSTSGSHVESFLNVTEGNFTDSGTNQTRSNFIRMGKIYGIQISVLHSPRCLLPTCGTHTLAHKLQIGDEKAGKSASDPYGPGKK